MQQAGPIEGPHLVRYGTPADQKFLLGPLRQTYDQIVINANMVAHRRAALALFLMQRARNKPYFIDPQTHAFQHDISHLESTSEKHEGEIKQSVQKLITWYGEPVMSRLLGKNPAPLLPDDLLKDREALSGFCKGVVGFQREAIGNIAEDSSLAKYYKFLKGEGKVDRIHYRPTMIIAPYFYLEDNTLDYWLDVNIACADEARRALQSQGERLGVQVVISRGILSNEKLLVRVISEYRDVRPAAFLIWIDSFPEHQASMLELINLVRLFRELGHHDTPVVNLYGGYFSTAVMRCGLAPSLAGVTHGLEYAEDRSVVPVGGGFPVPKFYLPQLHARLLYREAVRAVRHMGGLSGPSEFHSNVCDCKECRNVIQNDALTEFREYGRTRPLTYFRQDQLVRKEYPLPESRERCVRHYMWNKRREFRESMTVDLVVNSLTQAGDFLREVLGTRAVAHCRVWGEALHELAD